MPSSNTITAFNTFVAGTKARAEQVNTNFSVFRGYIIPVDPTSSAAVSGFNYGLGTATYRWGDSYIEKVNFGRTTTSWQIADATTAADDLVVSQGGTEKYRFFNTHDTTVEATQHLTYLINGDLDIASSEDGPRGCTHNATIRYARVVMEDGGTTTGFHTIRINKTGASVTSFNLTGGGSGVAINDTVTLTEFSVTSSDYITIDITAVNKGNNLHLKLY